MTAPLVRIETGNKGRWLDGGNHVNRRPQTVAVVLGANSFSGQDFVDLLLDDPYIYVVGISRSKERSDLFLRYKKRTDLSRYRYVQLDLNRDMPQLLELLDWEQPNYIVNFAAQSEVAPSWEHPEHWYQTNCVALAQLINHLRQRDYLERYMHISTSEVYGTCTEPAYEDAPLNPSTPYAASKAAADLLLFAYARQFDLPLLIVRGTNVYGARQQLFKLIPRCIIRLRQGREIELYGGGVSRKAFIHIRDVSRAELTVLHKGEAGRVYHISPDRDMAVRDVVAEICLRFGRALDKAAVVTPGRPGEDAAYLVDSTATHELGWRPQIDFRTGLDEVFDWIDEYWDQIVEQPLRYEHRA